MIEIKIDQIGIIRAGDEVGSYVKVIDDEKNTGGFLILTSCNSDMSDGFDNWVEDKTALSQYFHESEWDIEWLYGQ